MPTWPADQTALEDAIATWAQTVLQGIDPSWTVFWANQDHPAPPKPFARLDFLDTPQEEAPASEEVTTPVPPTAQNDVRTPAFMILEVALFSSSDQAAARAALRQSIAAEWPHREALAAAGWTVGEIVADRDLSQKFAGREEYRGVFELRLRVTVQHTIDNYPWIETANPAVIGVT